MSHAILDRAADPMHLNCRTSCPPPVRAYRASDFGPRRREDDERRGRDGGPVEPSYCMKKYGRNVVAPDWAPEAEPCADCGTTAGTWLPYMGCFRRFSAEKFGAEGVLCDDCRTDRLVGRSVTAEEVARELKRLAEERCPDEPGVPNNAWESLDPADACKRLVEAFDGAVAWDVFGPRAVVRGGVASAPTREDAA